VAFATSVAVTPSQTGREYGCSMLNATQRCHKGKDVTSFLIAPSELWSSLGRDRPLRALANHLNPCRSGEPPHQLPSDARQRTETVMSDGSSNMASLPEAATAVGELGGGFVSETAAVNGTVIHYANAYRDPDQLRSAFEFYRAISANAAYNAGHTDPIDVALLLVGGEHLFGPILPQIADSLRTNHGWTNVRVHIINDARHYLVEERPDEVAQVFERHTASSG
jgi:pimeloyl-ACP methyl ester carboxylesterase